MGFPEKSKGLLPDWIGIEQRLEDVPSKSIIIVDEAYISHHAREWQKTGNRDICRLLNLSRQQDKTIVFIAQLGRQLDIDVVSSADVLVISSHYESFGLVGLEALACGRPVVSTPVGAVESLIQHSQAGQIASDTQPRSLAKGIQSIITQSKPPQADEIRKSVLKYSWSNVAAAILKEYETAIWHHSWEDDCLVSAQASCG